MPSRAAFDKKRRTVGARDGDAVYLKFSGRGGLLTGILTWRDMRVGHVYIAIEDGEAILQDIVLQERVPTSAGGFLRQLLGRPHVVSFRGSGFGTEVIKAVFELLPGVGVSVLKGEAVGPDVPRLLRWYRSLGFTVDEDSARIEKRLP